MILLRHKRWLLLITVGAMVGGALYLFGYRGVPVRQAATPSVSVPASTSKVANPDSVAQQEKPSAAKSAEEPKVEVPNLFAVRTWVPPPPVIETKPVPPPPPQAPPLPFKLLGRIGDPDTGSAFMLLQGDKVLSVKVGDIIDNTYLVENFDAGQLHFLYQPMNIRQSLFVGHES